MLHPEVEERWAIHFLSNGSGEWAVPEGNPLRELYDRVLVLFPIDETLMVYVRLRKGNVTLKEYVYEFRRVPNEHAVDDETGGVEEGSAEPPYGGTEDLGE